MKFLAAALLIFAIFLASSAEDRKPYTKEYWQSLSRACFNFLRTPQAVRDKIEQRQFEDDDNDTALHCALRCTGIVSGTYDDDAGSVMEMMAVQAQGKTGFEEYRKAAEECYRGFGAEDYGDDWCKKFYLYFKCDWKTWREHVKKVE